MQGKVKISDVHQYFFISHVKRQNLFGISFANIGQSVTICEIYKKASVLATVAVDKLAQ